jgi:hypothetical protein
MESKDRKISKLQAVIITLCTVLVGLTSYTVYILSTENESLHQRCEYNGWAYADGESFPSSDGCNTCICSNGETVCTEMACTEEDSTCTPEEECSD